MTNLPEGLCGDDSPATELAKRFFTIGAVLTLAIGSAYFVFRRPNAFHSGLQSEKDLSAAWRRKYGL